MSKKKATMTLKDFHGGSIPSDLPLPSAPGVIVRPSDRASYDRQSSWGNPMGRSDYRLRPGSAGAARTFDEKSPFLTHSAHIGRNFEEDERKPLDGVSGPRRTVSDENVLAMPSRMDPKPDYSPAGRVSNQTVSTPVSQLSSGTVSSSYASRFAETNHVAVGLRNVGGISSYVVTEGSHVGVSYPNMGGNIGQAVAGSYPNAWGLRKEVITASEPGHSAWSAPDTASKLANASALEKVSSGRWHTTQPVHHQTDVEVIRHPEAESEPHTKGNSAFYRTTYPWMDEASGREYHDTTSLARHAERSLAVDDVVLSGGKELSAYERPRSPMYSGINERNPSIYYADEVQQARSTGKFGGPELQSPVPSQSSERSKLKLIPRSMPLENTESPVDDKLGYHHPSDPGYVENGRKSYGTANLAKPGIAGAESGNRAVERPKLSLKPRSQPLEQLEGHFEKERNILFGGARPRELVLKERGVDDVVVNNHDLGQPPNRFKQDVPKTETLPTHATPARYNERAENLPLEHRIKKNTERRDHRVDGIDAQRRNWQSENWRNREIEKHQHQQPQERPPSPETWRKPVDQQRPTSGDGQGLRYGKVASAMELAQAFSKSVSDPKTADQFSGQRGLPNRGQMPFSRLTGPNPRPRINGY